MYTRRPTYAQTSEGGLAAGEDAEDLDADPGGDIIIFLLDEALRLALESSSSDEGGSCLT